MFNEGMKARVVLMVTGVLGFELLSIATPGSLWNIVGGVLMGVWVGFISATVL